MKTFFLVLVLLPLLVWLVRKLRQTPKYATIRIDPFGPWLNTDTSYPLTFHFDGNVRDFFGSSDGELKVVSPHRVWARLLNAEDFNPTQTFDVSFPATETGELQVTFRSSVEAYAFPIPYAVADATKPITVTVLQDRYIITFNPKFVPKEFVAFINDAEFGYFTVQDQMITPPTPAALTIYEVSSNGTMTPNRTVYAIP